MKFFTVTHGVLGSPSPEDLALYYLFYAQDGAESTSRRLLAQAYAEWENAP